MHIIMNGEKREFPVLGAGATLGDLIAALELKGDRIAVEHNGAIVSRKDWPSTPISENDKLEVVHFVGGGSGLLVNSPRRPFQPLRSLRNLTLGLLILLSGVAGSSAQGHFVYHPETSSFEAVPPPLRGPTFLVSEFKPGADLKIVAYGDSRFTNPRNVTDAAPRPRKWLVDRIAAEAPDAIFFSGDMPFEGSNAHDWVVYQQETEPWRAAHLRLFPTLGNHEFAPDPRTGLANYFANLPQVERHRWYSVQIGNVYLIALDSMWPPAPGTAQRAWLEAQLAGLPASVDFVFFLSHMPLVTDLQTQMAVGLPTVDAIELRTYLESESLKAHAKFVVINGHIHNYERYERNGVSYIVTGGGGAKPYPVMMRGDQDLYRQPGFPNFHYLVFHIHGKHADVTMNRIADPQAAEPKFEVKDTFTLDAK